MPRYPLTSKREQIFKKKKKIRKKKNKKKKKSKRPAVQGTPKYRKSADKASLYSKISRYPQTKNTTKNFLSPSLPLFFISSQQNQKHKSRPK
jgi:hypothetical protein